VIVAPFRGKWRWWSERCVGWAGKMGLGRWMDGFKSDEFGMNAILLKYARNAHTQTHPLTRTHTHTLRH